MDVQATITASPRIRGLTLSCGRVSLLTLIWISLSVATCCGAENSITGDWHYKKDSQQEAARQAAIKKATASMSFLARGMARKKLQQLCTPQDVLKLKDDGETIDIHSGEDKIRLKSDGVPRRIKRESGTAKMTCKRSQKTLFVRAEADSATRTTEFLLAQDGRVLTVKIKLSSQKLDQPIEYELSYERATN